MGTKLRQRKNLRTKLRQRKIWGPNWYYFTNRGTKRV